MKRSAKSRHPQPRFKKGDKVDVMIAPPRIGDWSDAWESGTVVQVTTYLSGPLYKIDFQDGVKRPCFEESDLRHQDA